MIIGIFSFILFLFCTYVFSRDDFILLRKNISLEQVFNTVFISLPAAFIASRIGYILLKPNIRFLNPFVFFLIPYFPGLSLNAGILGIILFLYLYSKNQKIPFERLSDIFAVSFFIVQTVIYFFSLCTNIIIKRHIIIHEPVLFVLYVAFSILFVFWLTKGRWKDGVTGALILVTYSSLSFIVDIIPLILKHKFVIANEWIFIFLLFIVGVIIFVKKQILPKGRRGE